MVSGVRHGPAGRVRSAPDSRRTTTSHRKENWPDQVARSEASATAAGAHARETRRNDARSFRDLRSPDHRAGWSDGVRRRFAASSGSCAISALARLCPERPPPSRRVRIRFPSRWPLDGTISARRDPLESSCALPAKPATESPIRRWRKSVLRGRSPSDFSRGSKRIARARGVNPFATPLPYTHP